MECGYYTDIVIICIYVNIITVIDKAIKNDNNFISQREIVHKFQGLCEVNDMEASTQC